MINFKSIELSDKEWMDRLFRHGDLRGAEYNFTSSFLWGGSCDIQVAEVHGCFAARRVCHGNPMYVWPVGDGDTAAVLDEMIADARSIGAVPKFYGLYDVVSQDIEKYYPGMFRLEVERQWFDYVYSAEKMASLAGKKLHGKRNHINKFIENNPDWHTEPITQENLKECEDMNRLWFEINEKDSDIDYSTEKGILDRVFKSYDILGFEGLLLRSGGRVIAYTMGEKLCSDTFITHFEKAFSDIQGAYPMINREFSKVILSRHPEIVYINREDDMGLPNLRKAKLSYFPEFMVEKCSAIMKI